jgi:predicted nucleic acid-binding protein
VTDLLLDTDAVSILFKPAHPLYQEAYGITVGNHLVIGFMTLAELSVWPIRNNWGGERRALLKNFIALYTPLFPDETTCQHWADISAESLDASVVTSNPANGGHPKTGQWNVIRTSHSFTLPGHFVQGWFTSFRGRVQNRTGW